MLLQVAGFLLSHGWVIFHCACHIIFIHSSIRGYLDCLHVLDISNNATSNVRVQISLWERDFISFSYIPRSEIARLYGSSIFSFEKPLYCFQQRLHQFIFPPTVYKGSLFSISSPMFVICVLFDDSHSDKCEVISHCGFDLHFPDN